MSKNTKKGIMYFLFGLGLYIFSQLPLDKLL